MRLYFIRHAQSADNLHVARAGYINPQDADRQGNYTGRQADPELTDTGKTQAEKLGCFLTERANDNFQLTHIYSSLMVRSMDTATPAAKKLGIKPDIWEDLHETGGIWKLAGDDGTIVGCAGENRPYFQDRFPDFQLPDTLDDTGWWNKPLETPDDIKARAKRVYEGVLEKHGQTDDRVAIVSHGYFLSFMFNAFLKIPPKSKIRFAMNNTAITRLDFIQGNMLLVYLNRIDHLPPELVT